MSHSLKRVREEGEGGDIFPSPKVYIEREELRIFPSPESSIEEIDEIFLHIGTLMSSGGGTRLAYFKIRGWGPGFTRLETCQK